MIQKSFFLFFDPQSFSSNERFGDLYPSARQYPLERALGSFHLSGRFDLLQTVMILELHRFHFFLGQNDFIQFIHRNASRLEIKSLGPEAQSSE